MALNSGPTSICVRCNRKIGPITFELCEDCQKELQIFYEDIFSQQPKQIREIDQFSMDFESVIYQNLFLKKSYNGNVAAFFGGYDGVGLLSNFFGEKSVLVFDIIPDVLIWWSQIGYNYGFEVFTIEYDARERISDEIKDKLNEVRIDLWRTDPPFNCAGVFCFLSRIFYLNFINAPIFVTIPTGNRWSQLLKHNVWKFIHDSGMKITDVSPYLFKYPHIEGADSFAWKIEVESPKSLIPNDLFEYNIYSATSLFANSDLGCKQYDLCKAHRKDWDAERESSKERSLNNRRSIK